MKFSETHVIFWTIGVVLMIISYNSFTADSFKFFNIGATYYVFPTYWIWLGLSAISLLIGMVSWEQHQTKSKEGEKHNQGRL